MTTAETDAIAWMVQHHDEHWYTNLAGALRRGALMPETNRLRLAAELETKGASRQIIDRLRAGYYDEFSDSSPLELYEEPDIALVEDLRRAGLHEFAARVTDGKFDATTDESAAWAARQTHDHRRGRNNCTRCILDEWGA